MAPHPPDETPLDQAANPDTATSPSAARAVAPPVESPAPQVPAQASTGLVVDDVRHAYGTSMVLDGMSLTALAGEITCLLGASGAGKSTVLRLIAGHERLQSGHITLNGAVFAAPGHEPPPEKRAVGLMFQDAALFPHMRVLDNVAFGLAGAPKAEQRARAHDALEAMGLGDLGARYPHQLSGGQAQRVALARTLAPRPRIVLMDEPFANVDPTKRRALRDMARETLKASGAVVIVVTHDPDEAMDMADTIAVTGEGRILQQGPPEALYHRPEHPAVCAALGGTQALRARVVGAVLETPCGPVHLRAAPEARLQGRTAEAVLRPEALHVEPASDDQAVWSVRDVRFANGGCVVLIGSRQDGHRRDHRRDLGGACLRAAISPGHTVAHHDVSDLGFVRVCQSGPIFLFTPEGGAHVVG